MGKVVHCEGTAIQALQAQSRRRLICSCRVRGRRLKRTVAVSRRCGFIKEIQRTIRLRKAFA
jgi:hypothetical protein